MESHEEPGASQEHAGGKRTLFLVSLVLLALALAAVAMLTVMLVGASNDSYESGRGLLLAIEDNPGEMLYYLRDSDSSGVLLQTAMTALRDRDSEELDSLVDGISKKLMGSDQVAFFTSDDSHGVENARILGYFNGCLHMAGVDEQPYPMTADGEPYDGASEVPYEQEFNSVVGSGSGE